MPSPGSFEKALYSSPVLLNSNSSVRVLCHLVGKLDHSYGNFVNSSLESRESTWWSSLWEHERAADERSR